MRIQQALPAKFVLGTCTTYPTDAGLTVTTCWLQVWLGQKVVPAFDSPAWADVLSGKAPQRGQSPDRSSDQSHGNSAEASAAEGSAEQGQHPGDSVAIPGRQRGAVCAAVELPSGVNISIAGFQQES